MGYGNWSGCIKWFYDITEIAITAKVMLPKQGYLVVNEKSSLGKLYCRHNDLDNRYAVSVSQSRTCSVCRNHKPILSSFMTYHLVCKMSNTTDVTCGAGTSYTSCAPGRAPGFNGIRVGRFLVFCVMYCRSMFVLLSSFFWSLYCLSFSYLPLWYLPAFLIEPEKTKFT
jgi:hypothetical protein